MPPDVLAEKELEEKASEEERARLNAPLPPPNVTYGGWTITGRVLDHTGVPLPGVQVRLYDGDVPIAGAVTNVDGRYAVGSPTAPQNPSVIADLPGFGSTRRTLSNSGYFELLLQPPYITEAITVTAAAPAGAMSTAASASTTLRDRRALR